MEEYLNSLDSDVEKIDILGRFDLRYFLDVNLLSRFSKLKYLAWPRIRNLNNLPPTIEVLYFLPMDNNDLCNLPITLKEFYIWGEEYNKKLCYLPLSLQKIKIMSNDIINISPFTKSICYYSIIQMKVKNLPISLEKFLSMTKLQILNLNVMPPKMKIIVSNYNRMTEIDEDYYLKLKPTFIINGISIYS